MRPERWINAPGCGTAPPHVPAPGSLLAANCRCVVMRRRELRRRHSNGMQGGYDPILALMAV